MRISWVICILLFITACIRDAEPEIFLVPNNYKGVVIVLFDQEGASEEFEGNKRIYVIPKGGILETPFPKTMHGKLHQQIFYVNDQNEKIIEISTDYPDGSDSVKIYMMNGVYGDFYSSDKRKVYYRSFTLGTYQDMDSLRVEAGKKLEEIKSNY